MQINRRSITNGLAWAGLVVVVTVPVADAVSKQLVGDRPQFAVASVADVPRNIAPVPAPLSQRPHAPVLETAAVVPPKPAAPAVVKPAVPAAAQPVAGSNPVDNFLSSGKALPSYITGGDAEPAQAAAAPTPIVPAPAVTKPAETAAVPSTPAVAAPAAVDPIEVATVTPAHVAPVPMPLSMRPKPVTQPLATNSVNDDIVVPPEVMADNGPQPVVVDDLQDWESGPLSEFLAKRQARQPSAATVTSDGAFQDGYYDDSRRHRRPPRDIYIGPVQDDEVFFPFVN